MINVEMIPIAHVGGAPLNIVQQEARPSRAAAQQGETRRQNLMGVVFHMHAQRAEAPNHRG